MAFVRAGVPTACVGLTDRSREIVWVLPNPSFIKGSFGKSEMIEKKINVLIEDFNTAAKNHYEASLIGDWRTANKNAAIIRKTVKKLRSFGDEGREALLSLSDSEELSISAMAAVYSLKYAPEKSLSVLNRIAKETSLIGFEAGHAIQGWNEGTWRLEE